jgi:ferrous iron transport protein B
MTLIFQSIFTWAEAPMNWISGGIDLLSGLMRGLLPAGPLESLVVEGMIAGVGNVVIFLPQILLLFFFIALFEDTGYMARAVFVLDRLMKKVGLNGKAFLPLLSSFACAVPGVMASRTVEDRNDRLATILVAPLMSCSARLPVYTLMIAACIPAAPVLGILSLQTVAMISMYGLSLSVGLGIAALFRKTFLKGNRMPFVFELPPYRVPHLKTVFVTTWDRGKEFIVRAGSIIFLLSVVLWFLVNYPKDSVTVKDFQEKRTVVEQTVKGEALELQLSELDYEERNRAILTSYAGQLGKLIEPAIRPLGFNWEIGIGLVASFAAREVIVSTLAIIHHVGGADDVSTDLVTALQKQRNPQTGKIVYTPLVGLSLMVFYVLACQCLSTIVVVKRETGGWAWPLFMIVYMTALAWTGSFIVYQGGRLLGFS